MGRLATLAASLLALTGCSLVPWDHASQRSRIEACYAGGTPNDVNACLAREDVSDPAYVDGVKPGSGVFCTPDLDQKDCRTFLETVNTPSTPGS